MDSLKKGVSKLMAVPFFFSKIMFQSLIYINLSYNKREYAFVNFDYEICQDKFSVKIYFFSLKYTQLIRQYTNDMINSIKGCKVLKNSGFEKFQFL